MKSHVKLDSKSQGVCSAGQRMNWKLATAAVAVVVVLSSLAATLTASAQESPEFDVDLVTMRDSDTRSPRVEIYTKLPLSRLRFINSPNGFVASYEVSVDVVELDEDGRMTNIVQSPLWERNVQVPVYAQTTDVTKFDFSTHSLRIDPGTYVFEFQIQDKSSSESFVVEKALEVRDIGGRSVLSDLLLLEDFDASSNTIFPSVSKRLMSNVDSLEFFYEMYLDDPREITINQELQRVSSSTLPAVRSAATVEAATEQDNVAFRRSEERSIDSERAQLVARMPVSTLQVGVYRATFTLVDAAGETLDAVHTTFEVHWSGLDEHLSNLDEAIAQLQYIAKSGEIRRIREPESRVERFRRFVSFWERRDPTPGTTRNEKMEEYYFRVAHANRQYGSITEGWRTDRGQVWVLYGEPEFVERHPYNFNVKPYEVWFYQRIGRRFIFVDQTGLGDYQLLVPIWDETTRIR